MKLKTEYEFVLPRGYVDSSGTVHREGVMRLSTSKDEIVPLTDLRVQRNRAYLIIVLLSRVLTKLGNLDGVSSGVVENLYAGDLRFLEEMYNRINEEEATISTTCPDCGAQFEQDYMDLADAEAEEA